MVERGPFVMRTTALYVGRTDTMSEGSETLKLSSNWEALMMLLLKLSGGLIPASVACRPGNTSGRVRGHLGLVSCIDTAPIALLYQYDHEHCHSLHFTHSITVFRWWWNHLQFQQYTLLKITSLSCASRISKQTHSSLWSAWSSNEQQRLGRKPLMVLFERW